MSEKAKVLSFTEHMSNLSDEELAENIRAWQQDQDKLARKMEVRRKEMFNRPMAKALAMVRANTKRKNDNLPVVVRKA